MFRISIKIIGTMLAAVAVAVPVSSAGGPRTPAEGNSLGVLPEYQQPDPEQAYAAAWPSYRGLPGGPKLPSDRQVFSLSTALAEYQRKSEPRTPRVGEGFSFKAPSYWNAGPGYWSTAQSTGAAISPSVGMNHSLGVPPQYLGTGTKNEPRTPRVGEGFSFKAPSYWKARPSYWSTVERLGAPTAPDPEHAYAAAWPSYRGLPGGPPALPVAATDSRDFDWGDAGMGAAGMLGIMLLAGGLLAAFIAAHNRRETRHA
jgi:hypothetical protein